MTSGASTRWAKLAAYAKAVGPRIDEASYYQLLGVPDDADLPAIRAAFYRAAANLHPDRYHSAGEPDVRAALQMIYARITEGYRVLSNPERRVQYDQSLAAGQRRLVTTERERKGPKSPDESITHPEAKKFYRLALQSIGSKDWKGALMNLRFAHNFDPSSPVIAEKIEEVQAAMK